MTVVQRNENIIGDQTLYQAALSRDLCGDLAAQCGVSASDWLQLSVRFRAFSLRTALVSHTVSSQVCTLPRLCALA